MTLMFREDLFYRLNVIPIKLPCLKDRFGDVPVLIDYFLKAKSSKLGKDIPSISKDLYQKMISYCWPGNIRELENCVENIINLGGKTTFEINFDECTCMSVDNLGNPISQKAHIGHVPHIEEVLNEEEQIIPLCDLEKEAIAKSIRLCSGNISEAAIKLGISRNTMYNKMKKYGINK